MKRFADGSRVDVGARVRCNGYEGTITEIGTGRLDGMVEVRLAAGAVCVSLADVAPLAAPKPSLYRTALHARTASFCRLIRYDADGDRYFCDFGQKADPFTWVAASELSRFTF